MTTQSVDIACDGPDVEGALCGRRAEARGCGNEGQLRAELTDAGWLSMALVDPCENPVVLYVDQCPDCAAIAPMPYRTVVA